MGEAAEMVRLFFALWPESELQNKIAVWAKQAAGRGRAMRTENLHLTLAFLGATDPALLPEIDLLATDVRFAPVRLDLDRVGYWKHKRIIWCSASEEPQPLLDLVESLRTSLDAAGMRYDRKPFVPHVTLVRDASGLPPVPVWTPFVWEARDFALVSSARAEGRVSYRVLQRYSAAAD